MKIIAKDYQNEGSSSLRESNLEIGDHGFILELVMKDMYSDPIKAICREIASNCRDAHREMGTPDKPIQISLPSKLESTIKFKDWGPGISPSRMDNIYTKVGRSTKRSSNDETGGFGLGAKTPFAYTSQFSVVTTCKINSQDEVDVLNLDSDIEYKLEDVKGKHLKCMLTASRGSIGSCAGAVKLHTTSLTDEPTGTEVIIGVLRNDIGSFINRVLESTFFWDVPPDFIGLTSDQLDEQKYNREPVIKGDDWFINKSKSYNYCGAKINAVVDGILYPINYSIFHDKEELYNENKLIRKINHSELFFIFNTGDIELTPNRELIFYTENTIKTISERIKSFYKSFGDVLQQEIDSSKCYLEAVNICKSINYMVDFTGDYYWKNNKIHICPVNIMNPSVVMANGQETARLDTYTVNNTFNDLSRSTKSNLFVNNPLIINDLGTSVKRANIYEFARQNEIKKGDMFHVLVSTNNDMKSLKQRIKNSFELDINELDVYFLSEYTPDKPIVPKKKTSNRVVKKGTRIVYAFNNSLWEKERINYKNDSGYYVILSHRNTIIKLSKNSTNTINNLQINKISKLLPEGTKIYGVKDDVVSRLGSGFKPLSSFFNEYIDDLKKLNKKQAIELCAANKIVTSHLSGGFKTINYIENINSIKHIVSNFSSISEDIKTKNDEYLKYSLISRVFYKQSLESYKQVDYSDLNKKIYNWRDVLNSISRSLEEKYPLIKHLDLYYSVAEEAVIEYVELINDKKKLKKAS